MDNTEQKLKKETEKWLEKLEKEIEEKKEEFEGLEEGEEVENFESVEQVENVLAYRDDTYHFLEEEDFIRAWESVVYSWGILETLERLGKLE